MKTKNSQLNNEKHLHFAVLATDVVIMTLRDDQILVRLMDVDRPPHFKHVPGFPGGLIRPDETAEDAARRIIREKAELSPSRAHLEQLYTFSDIDRDPRGRVVAVAYSAYIPWEKLSTNERKNGESVWWEPVQKAKKLAYDHDEILKKAMDRLHGRIQYTSLISQLMPDEFTLTELEQSYEAILGKELDKRNFRKKLDKLNLLEDTGKMTSGEKWRPAKIYHFKKRIVEEIEIL